MSKFAQILKEKRADMNLSLRSAAELIGISHTYLDKLEKGFDSRTGVCNKPTPDTLKLISDTYDISYIDLLKYCGYIPETPSDNIKYYNPDVKELLKIVKDFTKPKMRNLILYAKFLEKQDVTEN